MLTLVPVANDAARPTAWSLEASLRAHCSLEDNTMKVCQACACDAPHRKTDRVRRLPQTLIIMFKIFTHDPNTNANVKLDGAMDAPDWIDMSAYVEPATDHGTLTYHRVGSTHHTGYSAVQGHYYATSKRGDTVFYVDNLPAMISPVNKLVPADPAGGTNWRHPRCVRGLYVVVYERAAVDCGVATPFPRAPYAPAPALMLATYNGNERKTLGDALQVCTEVTIWKVVQPRSPLRTRPITVRTVAMDILGSTKWLSGDTISAYMELLGDLRDDVICTQTWFLQGVNSAGRRAQLHLGVQGVFGVRIMLVPWCCNYTGINSGRPSGTHWILAVAIMNARKVIVLDSWEGSAFAADRLAAANCMMGFLREQAVHTEHGLDGWTTVLDPVPAPPKQTDGSACGAFVCFYATALVLGQPLWFAQQDVPAMRQHISACLYRGAIEFRANSGARTAAFAPTAAAPAIALAAAPIAGSSVGDGAQNTEKQRTSSSAAIGAAAGVHSARKRQESGSPSKPATQSPKSNTKRGKPSHRPNTTNRANASEYLSRVMQGNGESSGDRTTTRPLMNTGGPSRLQQQATAAKAEAAKAARRRM